MVVPGNISREHVLRAIGEIDRHGFSRRKKARVWFLVFGGRRYPVKYVVSLANRFVNGVPLDSSSFTSLEAVAYLRRLGFRVIRIGSEEFFGLDEFDRLMYGVFEKFGSILKERFEAVVRGRSELEGVYLESEDTIRYVMFYALTTVGGVSPLDIYLEFPHESVPKKRYAKLDTFIASRDDRPALAFEMKLKTRLPGGRNLPKSQIAGSAFADILRLAVFKPGEYVRRYFVYVVDDEMIKYYDNVANRLGDFFRLGLGSSFKLTREYLLSRPKTTVREISSVMGEPGGWPEPLIVCRYKSDLRLGDYGIAIRIYEVKV